MAIKTKLPVLKAKDFASDQDVKWCPGCGDYAILNAVQRVVAQTGHARENTVFISGIGCSSRFPYYMSTYGFHSIHGRAPGFVSGLKIANPELDVWMVTGDGDGFSIGGNHMMHLLRRNVDVNVLLFNNRIYGLTKGQYSPTSEQGKRTKSTPMGSLDFPIDPIQVALAAGASFVARSTDKDRGLTDVLTAASGHRGTSFCEIYQNCNIFNDGAYDPLTGKDTREDNVLYLEHGKPMVFGKGGTKGLRMLGNRPEVVDLEADGVEKDDLLVHDETNLTLAMMLARLHYPDFPEPLGVFYRQEREVYEDLVAAQVDEATEKRGAGTLDDLFNAGDTYVLDQGKDSQHGLHD
ncbi:MAG: 2-oxoacid:ferredoxin oxidoreductase subunit beta [Planctomycetota bacterium]